MKKEIRIDLQKLDLTLSEEQRLQKAISRALASAVNKKLKTKKTEKTAKASKKPKSRSLRADVKGGSDVGNVRNLMKEAVSGLASVYKNITMQVTFKGAPGGSFCVDKGMPKILKKSGTILFDELTTGETIGASASTPGCIDVKLSNSSVTPSTARLTGEIPFFPFYIN